MFSPPQLDQTPISQLPPRLFPPQLGGGARYMGPPIQFNPNDQSKTGGVRFLGPPIRQQPGIVHGIGMDNPGGTFGSSGTGSGAGSSGPGSQTQPIAGQFAISPSRYQLAHPIGVPIGAAPWQSQQGYGGQSPIGQQDQQNGQWQRPSIPGDWNHDGYVNSADIAMAKSMDGTAPGWNSANIAAAKAYDGTAAPWTQHENNNQQQGNWNHDAQQGNQGNDQQGNWQDNQRGHQDQEGQRGAWQNPSIPGDYNHDGYVNSADIAMAKSLSGTPGFNSANIAQAKSLSGTAAPWTQRQWPMPNIPMRPRQQRQRRWG